MANYTEITIGKLNDLLFDWEIDHQQSERGQFLCFDDKSQHWVAADNRTSDFFIEEFGERAEAIKWLSEG